jgi:hypothetical protein
MREFDQAIEEKNIFFLFLHSSRTPVSIIVSFSLLSNHAIIEFAGN